MLGQKNMVHLLIDGNSLERRFGADGNSFYIRSEIQSDINNRRTGTVTGPFSITKRYNFHFAIQINVTTHLDISP